MHATDGISRTLLLRAGESRWTVATLLTGSVLFAIAVGAFLVVRRATGALTAPLPATQLVATAAGVCIWALMVHFLVAKRWVVLAISMSVLLLAVGCSYPGGRLVDWVVWLSVIGLVSWFPTTMRKKSHPEKRDARLPCPVVQGEGCETESRNGANGEQIIQRITRVRLADGKDALRGKLAAEFAPGERQTTLYIGFCPPFELMPQVDVSVSDDFEADLKLTQLLHNGAQLDVRLSEPAEEAMAVTVEFLAVAGQ